MREHAMERAFRRWVQQQGGLCLKLQAAGHSGFPDRTILMPQSCAVFVELKQPKGRIRKGQIEWYRRLTNLGHHALITDDLEEARRFVLTHTRTQSNIF